ncbi:hypothetical protein N7532_006019 [Penicillium argentinense]|uniref:DUF7703 domain-containing protein n=1 Tax=Penicillium argentinense TaxID=1131581 RepID=A0A9W9FF05_9EURO|nr:uncharacterized protein N7532_006019 [Penicillium argentinense]KAJ5099018.1 hypothetical protein N7532_006019 [Penicillium argentinense]
MAGETGPINVSRTIAMVMAALFALACWNVLEIIIATFTTFRHRQGVYFWSMLIASLGTLLHTISGFLRYFSLAPNFPMCVLICIGWYAMVTGQSVVLYSRLHLVTSHTQYPRFVLYMIIFDACAFHIPTTILFLGSNHGVNSFIAPFNIYERVQLTGFSVQETIISALYIWETLTSLRPLLALKGPRGQRVVFNVIFVNAVAILLDVALLATEYTNNFDIQTSFKPLAYSIKLKMEFTVLNSLVAVIRTNPAALGEIERSQHEDLHIQPRWSADHSAHFDLDADSRSLSRMTRRKDFSSSQPEWHGSRTSDYPMLSIKSAGS